MSSLVDFLRSKDARYNDISPYDLILQVGDPAWKAKQEGDSSAWDAITQKFPDFADSYSELRNPNGTLVSLRNAFLQGAADQGVLMPAEGVANLVGADSVADYLNDKRKAVQEALPIDQDVANSTVGQITQGVGQMVPIVAGGGVTGMVGKALGAAGAARNAFLAANAVGQSFQVGVDDARESGVEDRETQREAGFSNLPSAALEFVSDKLIVDRVLKPLLDLKVLTPRQIVASVGVNAAAEGLTEGAQQVLTNHVASQLIGYDPDRPIDKGVVESVIVGAAVGGIVSTVGQTVTNSFAKRQQDEERSAHVQRNVDDNDALLNAARARAEADLQAARARRGNAETPSEEESIAAEKIVALEAKAKRDGMLENGLTPGATQTTLKRVEESMSGIAAEAIVTERQQLQARLNELGDAIEAIQSDKGPIETRSGNGVDATVVRHRDPLPEELPLFDEAARINERLAQLDAAQAALPQQPTMEGQTAAKPDKAAKAVAKAQERVAETLLAAQAREGDQIVADASDPIARRIEDEPVTAPMADIDPAEGILARELEASSSVQEPQSGAGSAPDVDAGVETPVAPAPLSEPATEEPLHLALEEVAKLTPPLAIAHEPTAKAKTKTAGGAKSKDPLRGRTIIAMRDTESGKVYLTNYYEDKNGGYAEGMSKRGGGISIDRLQADGFEMLDHPWLLAEPAEVRRELTEDEYALWKRRNLTVLDKVQQAQKDGTPAELLNSFVGPTHPEFVNAVNYLVSTLVDRGSSIDGISPNELYAAVIKPVSESDNAETNLAQRAQMEAISRARVAPEKILREHNGKILGVFTPQQWANYVTAVNAGLVQQADSMLEKAVDKRGPDGADDKKRKDDMGPMAAWAYHMAKLGRSTLAYWNPSEAASRMVSTEKEINDGQTIADTIAADGPDHPSDLVDEDISIKDRAGLLRAGMTEDEADFFISEVEGTPGITEDDIYELLRADFDDFIERAVRDSENPRAVLRGAVEAGIRFSRQASAGSADSGRNEAGGSAATNGPEGARSGDGAGQSGAGPEAAGARDAGEATRAPDVAAQPRADEGAQPQASDAGDRSVQEPAGGSREEVAPKSPSKAKAITDIAEVADDADLDGIFGSLGSDLSDDAKFSLPSEGVRVGGQERQTVLDKLTKALAILIEKGVKSFSVALQYIAKRVGSDLALSAAGHLQSKWNEWRAANPQWGLQPAADGVKALTGIEVIRPPLQDMGEGKYPTPLDIIKNRYPSLSPEQKTSVNMILTAAAKGRKGFLLGDGTGVGKTRQILASAHMVSQFGGGKPVLVLTENRTIIDGNFTNDARAMGLIGARGKLTDLSGVKFGTYTSLARGDYAGTEYAAIFLDEAHKLRNPNSQAHIEEARIKRQFTVYATATPLDEIYQSIYFLSGLTGQTHEELEQRIGVRIKWDRDPISGKDVPLIESVPGVSEAQAVENLKGLRDEAMRAGLMVRRMYPFFGKMELMPVQITNDQRREENRIMAHHEAELAAVQSFGRRDEGVRVPGALSAKQKLSGQRTLDLARWTESQKAVAIYNDLKQQIAQGKSVVVMSDSSGPRIIQGLGGAQIDGLLDTLAAMLDADGIPYSDIRGTGNKAKAVAEFQSGAVNVALATQKSGGTGIDLDDSVGDRPRVAYIASLPFSALEFDQVIGRFSRRNTKSPAQVKFVFLAEKNEMGGWHPASLSESRRVSNLSRKLSLMRLMQGQRVDFEDIFGPMGNTEENERRLLSRTFTEEMGEDPKFSLPSGYTLPFEEEPAPRNDIPDDVLEAIAEEGMSPSAGGMLMGGVADIPSPGHYKIGHEFNGAEGRHIQSLSYNLDGQFIITFDVNTPPRRKEYGSRADFKKGAAARERILANDVIPGMSYLPSDKVPSPGEAYAQISFYDLNAGFEFNDTTGAAGGGRSLSRATMMRIVDAVNTAGEEVKRRFGVKKFWLMEGANFGYGAMFGGEEGELGQRTRIYSKLRLRGDIKLSQPIVSEKDLQLFDNSHLVAPPKFGFTYYQLLRQRTEARGVSFRETRAFAEKSWGAWSVNRDTGLRTIYLALGNVLSPTATDLRNLMHENVHDLFADESPADRVRILSAVAKLWKVEGSKYWGAEQMNRSVLRESGERQLEEVLAVGMAEAGVDQIRASGFASTLVRTVKEQILNVARWLLGKVNRFGWTEEALDAIALKLFENRVAQFASGDMALSLDDVTGGAVTQEARTQINGHDRSIIDPLADVPPADEGSLAANLSRLAASDALFSRPIGSTDTPADRVHQNLAPINVQLDVEARIVNALGQQFATEARALNRTPASVLRGLLGSPDLEAMRNEVLNLRDPRTGQPVPGVNPDHRPTDFRDQGHISQAKVDAYESIANRRHAVSDQLLADTGRKTILTNRVQRFTQDFDEARRNYLNADGLTSVLMRGVRQMLSDERKAIGLAERRRGVVMQQLRDLDSRPVAEIERAFGKVVERVLRNQISGRQFFDLLDGLRASGVDYKALRAAQVKKALLDVNALPEITADTDEAKVLLSTVLAFAKTHDHIMNKLELRREKSTAERTRIEQELNKLAATKLVSTQRAINAIPRTAKLEDRIKQTYYEAKSKLKSMNDELAFLDRRISVSKVALVVYDKALDEIGGEFVNARPIYTFGDGMIYNVPPRHDATPDQVVASKKAVALDTHRQITDRAALLRDAGAMTEWIAWRESTGARDNLYRAVKAQRDEILRNIAATESKPAISRMKLVLMVSPIADRMAAIGTPLARSIGAMVNKFADLNNALKQQTHRLALRSEAARDATMKLLPKGLTLAEYKALFLDPAKSIIEKQKGLVEEQGLTPEQAKTRLWLTTIRNELLNNPTTAALMGNKVDEVLRRLRVNVDADYEVGKFYHDFTQQKMGMGVRDEKLRVFNPATGEWEVGVRDSYTQGVQTFSRTLSTMARQVYRRMSDLGWGGLHSDGIADLYSKGGADAVRKRLAPFLTDKLVQRGFLAPMAENDSVAMFDAPPLSDGTTPEADPTKVRQAWLASNGDAVSFAEAMFDLHGGTTNRGNYIEGVIGRLIETYSSLHATLKDIDPAGAGIVIEQIKGMVPGFQIESRVWERMPTAWSSYHAFDRINTHDFNQRVAAQVAFGRDQGRLDAAFSALDLEAQRAQLTLDQVTEEVRLNASASGTPMNTDKQVERAIIRAIGAEEYKRLRAITKHADLIGQSRSGLISYFHQGTQTALSAVRGPIQTVQTMAWAMLQQPTSALLNAVDVFAPFIQSGFSGSTLKQSVRMMKHAAGDLSLGLLESFGLQLGRQSYLNAAYNELGLNDGDVERRLLQLTKEYDPTDPTKRTGLLPRFLRNWMQLQSFTINRRNSQHTGIRPLAPFSTMAVTMNRAATLATWQAAEDLVLRGLKFLRSNPAANQDSGYRLTAADLGLTGLDTESFRHLEAQLVDHGLDLTQMVREAQGRMAGPSSRRSLLSDSDRLVLSGLAGAETQLESSLATMAPGAYTSPVARIALPLLGWSLRRGLQVPGIFKHANGRFFVDQNDKVRLTAVSYGALAIAAATVPALMYSVLIDWFQREVLHKSRNLPSVASIFDEGMDAKDRLLVVMENLNRVGTVGMIGDVVNTVVSSGAGIGDNRSIDLDQRVVFLNAAYSVLNAVNTWINQDFKADYAGVQRPLIQAVGGGGYLQWLQIANNAMGWENAEAKVTRRTNVNNILRVYGRMNGLDLRESRGRAVGPTGATGVTPHVVAMQLSAMADDYDQFVVEWKKAVAAELAKGNVRTVREAEANVKRAFQRRSPLRAVFGSLSRSQYATMLGDLPNGQSDDVRSAVDNFNRYGRTIGVTPYLGGEEKVATGGIEWDEADVRSMLLGL